MNSAGANAAVGFSPASTLAAEAARSDHWRRTRDLVGRMPGVGCRLGSVEEARWSRMPSLVAQEGVELVQRVGGLPRGPSRYTTSPAAGELAPWPSAIEPGGEAARLNKLPPVLHGTTTLLAPAGWHRARAQPRPAEAKSLSSAQYGPFLTITASRQLGDQEVDVGIALAVAHGCGPSTGMPSNQRARSVPWSRFYAAQEVLVGFAFAAVLGDDQAGRGLQHLARPLYGLFVQRLAPAPVSLGRSGRLGFKRARRRDGATAGRTVDAPEQNQTHRGGVCACAAPPAAK